MDERVYNFEPKTATRLQEEPWYADYQAVCEIMCSGPKPFRKDGGPRFFEQLPNGRQKALIACRKYLSRYPGVGTPPSDQRILNWIDSCWLTKEQIAHVKKLYETEN